MTNFTLITGGGSGLGYELAKLFAADGHNLVLVGREAEKLDTAKKELGKLYSIKIETIAADLTNAENIPKIFLEIKEKGIVLDNLVNNAGFGLLGTFRDLDIRKQLDIINLNISALVLITHLFLKQAPPEARILNISSMAAFEPGPGMNIYYASKAFVLAFSEALAMEMSNSKVVVTTLCPGPFNTNFWQVSGSKKTSISSAGLTPESVAKAGYQGLLKKRRIVVPGFTNKLLKFLVKILPRRFVSKIVYNLNKKFLK